MQERCRAGRLALEATEVTSMPAAWREELIVIGLLSAAVGGDVDLEHARVLLAAGTGGVEYTGYLHLAIALAPEIVGAEVARDEAERAIELISPVETPSQHNLALCVAGELEAAQAGSETSGMRYAKHQLELRWGTRLSTLATMRNLIQAERLSAEHALLRRHAFLDELTGLSNRRGFHRYVNGLASRGVQRVAMLLVDVDRFKSVNDRYGHAAGDATLERLARILGGSVRSGDLAARLGGDEFALLVADTHIDAVRERAQNVLADMVREPWREIHPDLQVTACIGIAAAHPSLFDELAARADAALYRAKAAGGAQYAIEI